MANRSKAKGRKGRIGKKKHWIAAYYGNQTNLVNKLRRLRRRLVNHPHDGTALTCVEKLCKVLPRWKVEALQPL